MRSRPYRPTSVPPQTLFQVCAKRPPTQRQPRRRRVLSGERRRRQSVYTRVSCIALKLSINWCKTQRRRRRPDDWSPPKWQPTTQAAGLVSQCRQDADLRHDLLTGKWTGDKAVWDRTTRTGTQWQRSTWAFQRDFSNNFSQTFSATYYLIQSNSGRFTWRTLANQRN